MLDPVCTNMAPPNPVLPPGNPAPSTRRMAERLTDLFEHINPANVPYLSDSIIEPIEREITNSHSLEKKLQLEFQLAIRQLNASHPDMALNTFAAMDRQLDENGKRLAPRTEAEIRLRKAMAYLRLGEQENCLATRKVEACTLPISPAGQHVLPRGSRAAISLFTSHLAEYPQDLGARWLLNLAHMTLGEYPAKVDPRYLIPPSCFASEYELPPFPDISHRLGLDANDLAGGTIVDDFDNDGYYDIIISAWDRQGQLRYFHNNRNGTFTERTSEAGLVGEVAALNIQQTDYNNDGLLDIWMLRGGWLGKSGRLPSSLLRNNGDGTFTDVTEEAGLLFFHPTMSSAWFDYDGDGWLDLFVGNESTDRKDPDWCALYHNNRNGAFTECARPSGIRVAEFVKGVACADYDNDGRPDLYLSVRDGKNILIHNDGPGTNGVWHFSNVTARSGPITEPIGSFGTLFFDYDNDGWQDLLVFGYYLGNGVADVAADYLNLPNEGTKTKLYHNNGDGTFSDATSGAHLNRICHTMGHNFGDLDNDGWLDFYCATGDPDLRTLIPNRMFRNAEGKFFQDVTTATRTGHLQKGHGVSFADLDDDGQQDIYCSLGGAFSGDFARNALFLNPGNSNHWVKLKLVGVRANRAAIGATLEVTVTTAHGPRKIHRVVNSGGSFGSNPLRQEIGLGDATTIENVQIRWPGSETRQTVTGLQLDHGYMIREGEPAAMVELHRVKLK